MITQALAQAVLAAALETGGDFSELYLEDTESNDLSMMGGTCSEGNPLCLCLFCRYIGGRPAGHRPCRCCCHRR